MVEMKEMVVCQGGNQSYVRVERLKRLFGTQECILIV